MVRGSSLLARFAPGRLHFQLLALFLAMFAGAIAFHAYYMANRQSDFMRRMIEEKAVALSSNLATFAAKDLMTQAPGTLDTLLLQADRGPGVVALSITGADGKVLSAIRRHADGKFRFDQTNTSLAPPDGSAARVIPSMPTRSTLAVLVAWSPIGGATVDGWVRAEMSLAPLQEVRSHVVRDSLASGSMVLALATITLTAFLRRPLRALREASEFAERLDTAFGSVLPTGGCTEEVEQLRGALNRTSIRLFEQHTALVDSELRYRSVVENLAEIVFQTDVATCWTYLNPAWETITRYSVQEALGRPLHEFVVAEDRDKVQLALAPLIAGESDAVTLIARYRAKDGGVRWVETSLRARRDAAGNLTGIAGTAADITERRSAEEHVRDQLRFVRQLIEVIPSPIYIKNTKGRYLGFNKAFAQFFGRRRRDFLGKTVFDLFPRDIAAWHHTRDAALLADPGVQTFEARVADRSGLVRDTLYQKATFTRGDGRLAGIVGVITDISERKLFERELLAAKEAAEAASRAKSDFLANMSHEIRTPMNAIIGMTDLALDTAVDGEQREYLGLVKASADALLTIINDILDFSKMETGRVDYESIPYSLRDCVRMAVRTMDSRARDKDLRLHWSVADSLPDDVIGDPHRLRQVLINLLDNAVRFTQLGGIDVDVVLVEQSADWMRLQFSVHDSGPGIARDRQQSIFEAFSQADNSPTRSHGGTGLGLAICSRLVHGMGGDIWVDSEPGAGSTFHFTARLGVSIAAPAAESSPARARGGDVRALIVAANPVSRRQLESLLASWNFGARAVAGRVDGAIVLAEARAQKRPLNVILLEHAGADDDEFTTAAALRSHAPDAPIIVLTAAGLRGDAARCREHGVSGYLVHPVPDDDLREAILLALKAPQAQADASLITRHSLRERRHHLNVLLAEEEPLDQEPAAGGSAAQGEAPAAHAVASRIFDRSAVLENLGGDLELFEAIASTFLAGHADSLGQLQRAVAAGDFDSAYREVHSIKGAASNFRADAVVHAALYAEACAQRRDAGSLQAAAEVLAMQSTALAAALQGELSTHPAMA